MARIVRMVAGPTNLGALTLMTRIQTDTQKRRHGQGDGSLVEFGVGQNDRQRNKRGVRKAFILCELAH